MMDDEATGIVNREVKECELCEEVITSAQEWHECQECGLLCSSCASAHTKMKVRLPESHRQYQAS